ncbi:MAG: penicillin-binding transpeptidase domain-containing protein [Defluviitaleaceae bacterium]|nr:penicillin-binding transpeptidase domain-containing protein [Defluviitaleaceae bacterium]MCL2275881.1 penicillin-binding transpeptidase domain-containing protein [Defluviitaleaceae bacterium]
MIDLLKAAGKSTYKFITHRLLWLFVLTAVLFFVLFVRLFTLQIVETDRWVVAPPSNVFIELPIQPLRGTIYDRHGRPLAINNLAFVVMMDPSVQITNEALLELTQLFEKNGERFVDNFPIALPETDGGEFAFTFTGDDETRIWRENRWKHDMAIPNHREASACESFAHLRRHFRIDEALSDADARRILNFRCQIFQLRLIDFANYNPMPILFASEVSHATMAAISERANFFTGVFIDIQTQREYPGGRYVSHIIGYLARITAGQYQANRHLGYTQQDLFGRDGLEFQLEVDHLRGTPGLQRIEVNRAGRRIGEPEIIIEPIAGDKIFLSIDLELQRAAYYTLKEYLTTVLINRLQMRPETGERVANHLPIEDALTAFIRNGSLDIRSVLEAEPVNPAYALQLFIRERDPNPVPRGEGLVNITRIIIEGLDAWRITPATILLALIGTEQVQDTDYTWQTRLVARPQDALSVLVEMLHTWELTPQQFNIDPSTGSIVILDVHTGGVLAAVSYPSFDNNRLVNIIDEAYLARLNTDPSRPLIYRALMEARAPGSTIKMVPAVAALEMGTIGVNTRISCHGSFTIGDEDNPLRCWARWGHGSMNISQAMAVSCNVFFMDSIFRIGNNHGHTTRTGHDAIGILNDYMAFFGLHEHTGTELWERYNAVRAGGYGGLLLPSPERYRHITANPAALWRDAYTAQVSIGQHISNYTPAQMARVVMGFANRRAPYPLHFVRTIEGREGQILVDRRSAPQMPESELTIADETWDAIIEGMRLATESASGGHRGTAVDRFLNFPIQIAGKTGTAEEVNNRFAHTAFAAFAPLDNPQIAVYVNVPFGDTRALSQVAARMARNIIGTALETDHVLETITPLNTVRP